MDNELNKIIARDLIKDVFVGAGVYGLEQKIKDSDANFALNILNDVIAKINNEDMFFVGNREIKIDCDGSNFYKLEDLPTDGIKEVYYHSDFEYTKLSKLSRDRFHMNRNNSDVVFAYFFDYMFPVSTLYILKPPSEGKLIIYTNEQIKKIKSLDDVIYMPDGWNILLKSNLSVRIEQKYIGNISDFTASEASTSKKAIKTNNQKLIERDFNLNYRNKRVIRSLK